MNRQCNKVLTAGTRARPEVGGTEDKHIRRLLGLGDNFPIETCTTVLRVLAWRPDIDNEYRAGKQNLRTDDGGRPVLVAVRRIVGVNIMDTFGVASGDPDLVCIAVKIDNLTVAEVHLFVFAHESSFYFRLVRKIVARYWTADLGGMQRQTSKEKYGSEKSGEY